MHPGVWAHRPCPHWNCNVELLHAAGMYLEMNPAELGDRLSPPLLWENPRSLPWMERWMREFRGALIFIVAAEWTKLTEVMLWEVWTGRREHQCDVFRRCCFCSAAWDVNSNSGKFVLLGLWLQSDDRILCAHLAAVTPHKSIKWNQLEISLCSLRLF